MPSEHRRGSNPPPLTHRPAPQHGSSNGHRVVVVEPRTSSHRDAAPPARRSSVSGRRPSVSSTSRPTIVERTPESSGHGRGRARVAGPPPPALANYTSGGSRHGRSSSRGPPPPSPGYASGGGGTAPRIIEVAPPGSSRRGRSSSRGAPPPSPRIVEVAPSRSSVSAAPRPAAAHTLRPSAGSSNLHAASARDSTLYTMGVEIETVLLPRTGGPVLLWKNKRATQATRDIAKLFNSYAARDAGLSCQNMVVQGDDILRGPNKYRNWALMRDASIGAENSAEEMGGIEFVSPILKFDAGKAWQRDIGKVFSTIGTQWKFRPEESCGTHVHVRPKDGWTMTKLKSVAKAILFFEGAICHILPAHRAINSYCMRNYHHNPVWNERGTRSKFYENYCYGLIGAYPCSWVLQLTY